jgi:autotransporter-associated beta strand protein
LGSASTISGVGTFAINGASNGAVNLNGKSLSAGTFTLNNGTVSSGTITAGTAINVEAGTVSATLDGAAGLTKSTAGTVTLSGTQAYTGNTVVTAGTLRLGNSDAIDNASKLVLNGGTFATQGNGDTLNTLQLTENSTIDMGSGSSQLDFAESFAEAWTAGKTLNITNYTNNLLGTGVDRIYVGTAPNGLTWAQLQQIKFVNPDGFAPGTYGATILSDGQVVIPEPASLGLIALGGTALLMRRRRKA